MPLFPDADGQRLRKVAAVATIVELASRMGQPTRCPSSQGQMLGGHSMRTGGAQALAGLGVDPIRIQTMGRWKSDLVIRYSGSRGSSGITRDAARGLIESGHLTPQGPRSTVPQLNSDTLAGLDRHSRDIEVVNKQFATSLNKINAYVLNGSSGVLHKYMTGTGRTLCGLVYANWPHEIHKLLPARADYSSLCARCCRHEANVQQAVEDSSESELYE